ncbi:hypothetical protein [Haploplasma modicum]|uniref:hypothetical protein n=1 Tax=Haploplasma modicum TaxID=2150 RepID=UPI00047CDF30|nr:hypothetical protein [Haploplasma modicum]
MIKHLNTRLGFDSLKNYQVPQLHKIITSYVVDNPEYVESIKKYINNIDFILEHLYNSFNGSIEYTEKAVLDLILDLINNTDKRGAFDG